MSAHVVIEMSQDAEQQSVLASLVQSIEGAVWMEEGSPLSDSWVIGYRSGALSLMSSGGREKPLYVDFVAGRAAHRRRYGGGRGQAIAKAVGLDKRSSLELLDITGGLGRDAFVLASLGCHVTVVERSAIVAALLADGIRRAEEDQDTAEIAARLTLIHQESLTYMTQCQSEGRQFDVVYIDPMFPGRDKSAAVKKEMKFLQALLGGDSDANELLSPALVLSRYRTVIKRSARAPDLGSTSPTYRLTGKSCRFDVHALRTFQA